MNLDSHKTSPGLLPPITDRQKDINLGVKVDSSRGVTFSERRKTQKVLKDSGIELEGRPLKRTRDSKGNF